MDIEEITGLAATAADENPMAALEAVAGIRMEMERMEAVLVRRARNDGTTRADIAAVLGVSEQAVHKKYRGRRVFGDRT